MKQVFGDIFSTLGRADALCVTTNGVIKRNGELVMGAGIALQAKQRFPGIAIEAAKGVGKGHDSHVRPIHLFKPDEDSLHPTMIVALPTKLHFKDSSPLDLVIRSLKELVSLTDIMQWKAVVLTQPGCGHGGLKWNYMEALCSKILDNRFYVYVR